MKRVFCCVLLFVLHTASPSAQAQHTLVALDHQVYPLLEKAESLQLFAGYQLRTLPLTRSAILDLLQQMQQKRERMSAADQSLLSQLLAEFTDPAIGAKAPANAERHLFRYEEGETQLFADLRMLQMFQFSRGRYQQDDANQSETTVFGGLRGSFGGHVFFGMRAQNALLLGSDLGDENFDPVNGRIQATVGQTAFSDQATGYLSYRHGRFAFLAGREHVSWGASLQDRLALSSQNEPMDLLQLTVDFRPVRLGAFHGKIQGAAGVPRYVAGHRLDFFFWRQFQFSLHETLIYSNRDIEPGYLNPLLPFHIMEHQLGDLDNNMLGFDFSWFARPGIRLSGELFIDDLSIDFPLGTYWGNKLAFALESHWVAPFGLDGLEAFAGYTRVDPFVYTHKDSSNRYSHYGESLGSRLGPNAERWQAKLRTRPQRDALLTVQYAFQRQGRGDLRVAHTDADGKAKGFLKSPLERRHITQLQLQHQFFRDIFLGLELTWLRRLQVNRLAGVNATERFGRFWLDVRY